MISDEKRQALTGLALKALDSIEEQYGEDAELGDAVIVYDVQVPDPDEPDGTPLNEGNYHSTSDRTVVVVGLLRMAERYVSHSEPRDEED